MRLMSRAVLQTVFVKQDNPLALFFLSNYFYFDFGQKCTHVICLSLLWSLVIELLLC